MKKLFQNLIMFLRYGKAMSPILYMNNLKKLGVKIGEGTMIYHPHTVIIDTTRPELIEIGNYVKITKGCTILTHGFDWSVLNVKYGNIMGSAGKVKIGDNVFIGMNSIILKGVTIGNNVIIGAGSVVSKDIPSNSVAVGNPVKILMDIHDYYEKRLKVQVEEAKNLAISWKERYHSRPPQEVFDEFFWLYENKKDKDGHFCNKVYENKMHVNGNYDNASLKYSEITKKFNSYEEFLDYCFEGDDI